MQHKLNTQLTVFLEKGRAGPACQMSSGSTGLNKVQQVALQQNFSEPLTAPGVLQEATGLECEDHTLGSI